MSFCISFGRTRVSLQVLDSDYFFDDDGIYPSVEYNSHDPHRSYMESIESMPMTAGPGVFGLHENANIACALAETFQMFDTIMLMEVGYYRADGWLQACSRPPHVSVALYIRTGYATI